MEAVLTILEWSEKIHAVAAKYLSGSGYVNAQIDMGTMSHWDGPRISYKAYSEMGSICTSFHNPSWEDALKEFEDSAILYFKKSKQACPTCGKII